MSPIHDIISAWPQWTVIAVFIINHTCVTFLADVPDCGKGYLGPGGLDDGGKHFNCTGGVAGYIDRQVFGNHMYKNPPCKKVYENVVFYDPEGEIETLNVVQILFYLYMGI